MVSRRPLLDYYSDDAGLDADAEVYEAMEARIAELERRFAELSEGAEEDESHASGEPAALSHPVQEPVSEPIADRIEAILRRREAQEAETSERQHLDRAQPHERIAVPAPSMINDRVVSRDFVPEEYIKFAEAVRIIGRAAERFIPEASGRDRDSAASMAGAGELASFSVMIQEAINAFRGVADDLAVTASELRRYKPKAAKASETAPAADPNASVVAADAGLASLSSELQEIRDRIEEMMRQKRNASS